MKLIKIIDKKYLPNEDPNNFIRVGKAIFSVDQDFIEVLFMIKKGGEVFFCISCQIGCPIGCEFCINKPKDYKRNLNAKEILSQIKIASKELGINLEKIPFLGVMFSGCGEPSLNPKNIIQAIKRLNKFQNCKVSITTTCAELKGIKQIIEGDINFGLQISLHGYSDKIRRKLIPSPVLIKEIFKITEKYYQRHKRVIDLNYIFIKNQNDHPEKIINFFSTLDPLKYTIRFSKLNKNNKLEEGNKEEINKIIKILRNKGFYSRYFESSGEELIAGCGQLRNLFLETVKD